jgi:ribonucleotide reductase beta subunit family protein with ferritin-like domain
MAAATVTIPPATAQIDYDDLYARWERGNWRATELDFSQDRIDWHERMTPEQRRGALWLLNLFFHGEDTVADTLSPYIDAVPLEEQKYFLATQQVDEARHSVFFKRFMHEVVGIGDGTVGGTLRSTMPELTWGHRQTFGYLEDMADRLRKSPHDRELLASAITLYHIMVEGGLAQSGQHTIERVVERLDILPGLREGMAQIAVDEQRHIAFGVRVLADLYGENPGPVQDAIIGTFSEVMPMSTCVAQIPGWDLSYTQSLGYDLEDLYEEGARMQEARLRAIGLPLEEIEGFPLPLELSPRERAERGIKLMKAQYLGPKEGAFVPDEEATEILFDQIRLQCRPSAAEPGTVIQWEFTDSEPWHLVVDNGNTRVSRGRAPKPDLTLRSTLEDWIDVTSGRADPTRLMLRRRLRARGNPRVLLGLRKLLG